MESGPRGVPGPGGGAWSWGVPGPRGVPSLRGTGSGGPGGDPPDGYCCGRYASYWNAFLLFFILRVSLNESNISNIGCGFTSERDQTVIMKVIFSIMFRY